jgi:serine-threonine kinase receptor-associated protein
MTCNSKYAPPILLNRWWDLRSLNEIHTLTFSDPVTSLELSAPHNTLVLTSGKDVSFVPLVPGQLPSHTVTLPHVPTSASLHPVWRDRFVAGSAADPWVRVYGYEKGDEQEVYKGHHGPVHCVEYSPDGEMYASGSGTFEDFLF